MSIYRVGVDKKVNPYRQILADVHKFFHCRILQETGNKVI